MPPVSVRRPRRRSQLAVVPRRPDDAALALLDEARRVGFPCIEERHEADDTIYLEGERGDSRLFLTEGVVKISRRRPDGGDLVTSLLAPGEVFGDVEPGEPRRDSAHAFTDCATAKIPESFLRKILREKPDAALSVLDLFERRLSRRQELARRLLPRKTEARLAALLPALAGKFPARTASGNPATGLRLTHADLAEMVGSTRESVSQAVGRMRREALIATDGGRFEILSEKGLKEMYDG